MNPERLETYALATVGLAKGLFEVYVKPLPGDMLRWAAKLMPEIPSQEDLDAHLIEVAKEYDK